MVRWLGAAALAAVLAAGIPAPPVALADDMNMGGATCSPAGTSLALTAQDHKFDKDCLAVPAGQSFTIRFDNKDSDRHNVAILPSHTSTETFFQGDIVPGPKSITYSVPALKPGTYHFHCQVHPNLMNGAFIVAAAAAASPTPAPTPMPAPTPAPMPAPLAKAAPSTPPAKAAPSTPPAMGMGNDKPAATPAPAPAAPRTAAAAPAMPAPKAAAAPAPAPKTAAAAGTLPHTGPRSARLLLMLAGFALAAGGLSVLGGARRAETR